MTEGLKSQLERPVNSYWSNRFLVLSLYTDAIFSSLGWDMKGEDTDGEKFLL